jgi:hypothetical protein
MEFEKNNQSAQSSQKEQGQENQQNSPKLVDLEVTDENMALNILVSFLNVANKRGAFTVDESAKIWECIKKFQKP